MQKHFTIFFSWQSDIKGCRKIITDSISASCQKLKEDKGITVELDEATRNCSGSPRIENVILEKIRNCDIFICDITPVLSNQNKHFPNPNVVYELGYAMSILGEERVIMISQNIQGLDIRKLPFDINHCRIGRFKSKKDCNLDFEIKSCVEFCLKQKRRDYWKQMFSSLIGFFRRDKITNQQNTNEQEDEEDEYDKVLLKATEDSTVFFSRRMANAFPGVRGLKVFTDKKEIRSCLLRLLADPLRFKVGLSDADTDPVWWFRAGSSSHIFHFRKLQNGRLLMATDELNVKRIAVFRDTGRYYGEYVYVELSSDKPCGCYKYPKGYVEDKIKNNQAYHEEYAVYKPKWYLPQLKLTRQEYDDGAFRRWGKSIDTHCQAELRVRYLTPYNFIITAKGSPFNCTKFDRTSGDYLDGILAGKITLEEFDAYMQKFPKKVY